MFADEINGTDCPFREQEQDALDALHLEDLRAEKWPALADDGRAVVWKRQDEGCRR